ncbi:unnamed protein product [Anisakis simplex]|uniref:Protein kinase domain-containing protein n=1 Tax=Anisakis simplex TaxID=6269 RepID=A0A0M3K739_ANISI|nr:unnamed protein product [Anisakis simplex]
MGGIMDVLTGITEVHTDVHASNLCVKFAHKPANYTANFYCSKGGTFFCGKFAECGYVDEIIYRNLQLPRPNCTFSIVNAYTIFNTKVFTGPVCVKTISFGVVVISTFQNDAQVDHVRKFLLEMGILRPDLIYYLKYKAKICSVCHITGNVNVKLPDSGQLLRFDPHIYYADLKIGKHITLKEMCQQKIIGICNCGGACTDVMWGGEAVNADKTRATAGTLTSGPSYPGFSPFPPGKFLVSPKTSCSISK